MSEELCDAHGGGLDPLARCHFKKGHSERYHSSDGSTALIGNMGYYWVDYVPAPEVPQAKGYPETMKVRIEFLVDNFTREDLESRIKADDPYLLMQLVRDRDETEISIIE